MNVPKETKISHRCFTTLGQKNWWASYGVRASIRGDKQQTNNTRKILMMMMMMMMIVVVEVVQCSCFCCCSLRDSILAPAGFLSRRFDGLELTA